MPADQIGSWNRVVTAGDGVWLTRGHYSQNSSYTVRNYLTGALLYYEHMCQKGDDEITVETLYEGTSAGAEGYGAIVCSHSLLTLSRIKCVNCVECKLLHCEYRASRGVDYQTMPLHYSFFWFPTCNLTDFGIN